MFSVLGPEPRLWDHKKVRKNQVCHVVMYVMYFKINRFVAFLCHCRLQNFLLLLQLKTLPLFVCLLVYGLFLSQAPSPIWKSNPPEQLCPRAARGKHQIALSVERSKCGHWADGLTVSRGKCPAVAICHFIQSVSKLLDREKKKWLDPSCPATPTGGGKLFRRRATLHMTTSLCLI